ncbi:MAG: dynamin family protein [Dechloromonas sp.]|nr:dynamin family protein [Dechloromonas sp.]
MSELLPPSLFIHLVKLTRLFVWRRKSLHDAIVEDLRTADTRHEALVRAHQNTQEQFQALTQVHLHLTERVAATNAELAQSRHDFQGLQLLLNQSQTQHQHDCEQARIRFDTLATNHNQVVQERKAAELALANELETSQKLAAELKALEQRHGDTWTRFQLISQLLAAHPPENMGLARFRQVLANDYMVFAESESSLAAEAKALLMLQSIEQELGLLVGFPDVFKRTIVGIVGGFSSGKSEFINSFILDREIRLAVGLQPVTAIPSYVLATNERLIRGYSANGGHIDLDVGFYKSISHAFINSFSFDLKSLMPFMCVGIQMDPAYFSNICFIDTPGYNPPATAGEYSQSDKQTAVQFAQQSDAIIWLIGLDANGTIPDSDLDFIQEIGVEHRSVYVVLNKADLRPEDDLECIMDEVESVLEYEDIPVAGISAYSSTQRRSVAHRGRPLMEHFVQINQNGDVMQRLEERLKEVFDMYDDAIQADIETIRNRKRAINGLQLDALEIGGSELYKKMQETVINLNPKEGTTHFENQLRESRSLLEAFSNSIRLADVTLENPTLPAETRSAQ